MRRAFLDMFVSTSESNPSNLTSVPLRRTTLGLAVAFLLNLQAKTSVAECPRALGMEDKRIPDSSITASSAYNSNYKAYNGRLNKVYTTTGWGGWFARWNTHQWFEVDFGSKVTISRIATQGHSDYDAWITEYALSHGSGSGPLISYNNNQVFRGNWDRNTIVVNDLEPVIVNRVVRILPKAWHYFYNRPALRTEFYGCRQVSDGNMTGTAISAESIHVAWQIVRNSVDNSLPCGFKVTYRMATENNESWILETVEATATQHTIRDLLAYTTYMIQVEALNGACSGTFSPAVNVTTHEKAPSAPPQNVTVVLVTYFGVLLKWLPPPNEKRNGRMLQYSVTAVSLFSGSTTVLPLIYGHFSHNDSSSEQQGLLEGLQEDTNYKIVIIASNSAGSSPSSSPVNFKTLQYKKPTSMQKDVQSGASSSLIIGLVVAAVVVLFAIALIILFVLYRRRKKGRGKSPKEIPEGSLHNNRVTAPHARHLQNTEDANIYLTSPDHLSCNSQEISMHKHIKPNNMSNFCDDVHLYAAPGDLSSTVNRKENAKSAQFAQNNTIYETAENGESNNANNSSETSHRKQENHIYTAVADQPSLSKETESVLTKIPVPCKRKNPISPPTEIGLRELPTIEDRSQMEPKYEVLEGPEPPTSPNNVSSRLYDEVDINASREKSEVEGQPNYEVIWSSSSKPTADTRSKPKNQETKTRSAVVNTSDFYDKLWVSGANDEHQQRNVEDNIYDNTYDTVGDSIH